MRFDAYNNVLWTAQFAAMFLAIKGIESVASVDGVLSLSTFFANPLFRNIIISVLATVGLYILASLIFVRSSWFLRVLSFTHVEPWTQLEPWHLITSFPQYLLMAPSYISVLNVYAVCFLFARRDCY